MSYDLMVFEPSKAPRDRTDFMAWYNRQTEWGDDVDYDIHHHASPALQSWFLEMVKTFPPMNGPLASDNFDDPKITDHCVGRDVIYSAFAWSVAEEAHVAMVGFFDVSSDDGEILFP